MNKEKLLKMDDLKKITLLGRSTIYRWIKEDKFPRPVKIGNKAVAWIEAEIYDWINQKKIDRQ